MADYDPPADLIKLRRDFLATVASLSAAGRDMPSQAWLALDAKRRGLAVAIQGHEYWETVDDRKAARKALDDAAG